MKIKNRVEICAKSWAASATSPFIGKFASVSKFSPLKQIHFLTILFSMWFASSANAALIAVNFVGNTNVQVLNEAATEVVIDLDLQLIGNFTIEIVDSSIASNELLLGNGVFERDPLSVTVLDPAFDEREEYYRDLFTYKTDVENPFPITDNSIFKGFGLFPLTISFFAPMELGSRFALELVSLTAVSSDHEYTDLTARQMVELMLATPDPLDLFEDLQLYFSIARSPVGSFEVESFTLQPKLTTVPVPSSLLLFLFSLMAIRFSRFYVLIKNRQRPG